MHITASPNIFSKFLGGMGACVVFYSSLVIWRELNKVNKKEVFLRVGIILTVLVVLNDSALGLEITGAVLPLYYLGNAFEAVRFNLHYQNIANQKLYKLENEVVRLSRVAQFGFTAASIAHDIANHLLVVKISVNKLLRGRGHGNEDNLYNLISKHNNKVSEISNLYMNIFKKNSSSLKTIVPIRSLIDEALELINPHLNQTQVNLETEIRDFDVYCNQTEISICLLNIIKNALEEVANNENFKKPWIKIIASDINKTIEVIDCGTGIDKELASSIFELGFSTKLNTEGHGIGLAITKQLLTRSGFKLEVNDNSTNTSFLITF